MSARLVVFLVASLLVACGSAGAPAPTQPTVTEPAAAVTQGAASPTATPLPSGATRFTVMPERVRRDGARARADSRRAAARRCRAHREHVPREPRAAARRQLRARLTISIELDVLKSDNSLRDEWIKINTLQTRRYPRAEFTAQSLSGVPLPLPASGELQAQLRGR